MPLTNAERQKRYREKLKNSERYEELRVKHLERVKKTKKKIKDLSKEEQNIQRQKWRDEKRKKNTSPIQTRRASNKNYTYRLTRRNIQLAIENRNLKETILNLTRTNNRLRQQNYRLKKKNESKENIAPTFVENESTHENILDTAFLTDNTMSPRKKTEKMFSQIITTPGNRDIIKKELFQLNVLSKSLEHEYVSQPNHIKTALKNVVQNEICKKYKVASKLSLKIGLKGRVRNIKMIKNRRNKISKEIEDFFCRDDISRATSGKKECLTRKSIKKQKRYLLDSMLNAHKIYRASGGKASYTTFIRYRPFYVVTPKINERDTCACIRHSNISLKVQKLKKLGIIKTINLDDLMMEIACVTISKECMYGKCSECKEKDIKHTSVAEIGNETISWLEWELKKHEYNKKDLSDGSTKTLVTKKYSKAIKTGVVNDLLTDFQLECKKFKRHYFNNRHQQFQFRTCKDNLKFNEAAIICDFSENYSAKYHEEIQSMHFGASRNQVSLHTGVIYTQSTKISFCSLSPNTDHDPGAIWAHLQPVIELIKEKLPQIDVLHFFTDGPCTQYKQKKNFFLLSLKLNEFQFRYITWNFFEASHGKGAADGIGGAIKRQLDRNVAYGIDITNAEEAFKFLSDKSKIKLFYISEEEVNLQQKIINDVNTTIMALKGTMQVHQVIVSHNNTDVIKYRDISCFCGEDQGLCECYDLKEHKLVKNIKLSNTKTKRTKNNSCKRARLSISSDSDADTEMDIVYAESDDSPWEEEDPLLDEANTQECKTITSQIIPVKTKNKRSSNKVTATQSRIQCVGCEEDLISDVEEDDLKNIGCDKCPRWFHLKCTVHKGRPFAEIAKKEYICHVCYV